MLARNVVLLLFVSSIQSATISKDAKLYFRRDYTYVKEQNAFYKFHKTKLNFAGAMATCSAEGSQLLIPMSAAEVETVFSLINREDVLHIWIGIHDIYSEGSFITLNGADAGDVYVNWANGEPNNNNNAEDCVIVTKGGTYNDDACLRHLYYVCKRSAEGLTQNSICETYDTGYTYNIDLDECYKLHTTPTKWSEAFRICRAEDSQLAIINSKKEAEMMVAEWSKYFDVLPGSFTKDAVYVGFSDLINNGVYLTIEGKPLSTTGYEQWAPTQPDNYGGNEHCGTMIRDGTLNDLNCDHRALFFCEKHLSKNGHMTIDIRHSAVTFRAQVSSGPIVQLPDA